MNEMTDDIQDFTKLDGNIHYNLSSTDIHEDCANALRMLAVDMVENANSGHPGAPMGMADIATVL
ncbi:Transketolase, thiamine diphosphate binding domain [Enterovibrio nigricans DSM 22720]|uniref:Transketolase, thiamine diphosphate binding domain n=1 Tax=Enterovibrio nigricans DSM 22720 TaxID=1121868 RepID=A0A1T4UYP2_9GAMM|nr:Transketolase, thiamine diphosphate binding domain [Enterovibrio nigricans DSM 22720]